MKTIMLMFDTLTRTFLSSYGNSWCHTPNFQRLEKHCCVFDNFYAGSLPCMPARRDLHTGNYNFLHRSWGPLEPFDYSFIQALGDAGIYTHLCTDHSHYFEDGGATYHNRYHTWEGFRGQEGDRWQPRLQYQKQGNRPKYSCQKTGVSVIQHEANMRKQTTEEEFSSVRTIQAGLDFLAENHQEDAWFLQIECFDPHEPFEVSQRYRSLYHLEEGEDRFCWPAYTKVTPDGDIAALRKEYAALLTMCDHYLGKLLDFMDAHEMWEDTVLIVNTDHGFLLGEHGYLGKNFTPMYQELVHLPFYMHVPNIAPQRRNALCQTIDIAPTLLELYQLPIPQGMQGKSLLPVLRHDETIHETVLFGIHGGHVNITDGRYVYMKAAKREDNQPYVECTLMPTQMRGFFSKQTLAGAQLTEGDAFSNYIPYLKYPAATYVNSHAYGDLLFDVRGGERLIWDDARKERMEKLLVKQMQACEAPAEEYERLGLHG